MMKTRRCLAAVAIVPVLLMPQLTKANDLEKIVESVIKTITKPMTIVPEIVADILKGKSLSGSSQNHVHQYLDAQKGLTNGVGELNSRVLLGARKGVRAVGGNVAGDIVDTAMEPLERLNQYAAASVGAGVEISKGNGLVSIPAELLAAELRLAETTLLPVARGLPQHVRDYLGSKFPEEVYNQSRYVVGNRFSSNVAQVLNSAEKANGSTNAVTVGRVIVFESSPKDNYEWWAHELGHVQQYMEYGFDGFARRYVQNRSAIERDADRRAL